MRGLPDPGPGGILTLKLVHTQSPKIHQNYHVNVPTHLWFQCLLPQINWFQLWFLVFSSLSRFGCGNLLYNFSSLMDLRKVISFQLVQCFSCCKHGSEKFQALYLSEPKKHILIPLLNYISHIIKLTYFKYKIEWFLATLLRVQPSS